VGGESSVIDRLMRRRVDVGEPGAATLDPSWALEFAMADTSGKFGLLMVVPTLRKKNAFGKQMRHALTSVGPGVESSTATSGCCSHATSVPHGIQCLI
jgi:hypothetical protein